MNWPVDLDSERVAVDGFPTSEVTPPIHCPKLVISEKQQTLHHCMTKGSYQRPSKIKTSGLHSSQ